MTTCVAEPTRQYVRPRTDIVERDGRYTVMVELPGIGRDQIAVEVEENVLTVKTARREQTAEARGAYLVRERLGFDYTRSFTLGEQVDPEHIEANWEAGVLTLQLKKIPAATPKRVEIR